MSTGKFSLTHLVREPPVETAPRPPLLVLLHGIGSNEEDLFGLAPYLDGRLLIVSARAPIEMWPGGYGWFNIEFTPRGMLADIEQAKRSLRQLPGFVDELVEAYDADAGCVYLMGFSQGAMMSLALALTAPEKIAGAVLMSGRFPAQALEREADASALAGKPFMVTHGIYDPVLPIAEGRVVRDQLEALPVELTYREYPMAHEVSMESLKDVAAWLSRRLDEQEKVAQSQVE
ncbi:MAG TPA: alpha/beta fold hydrolase [Pyrinomonadaceae bacterium]